MSSISSNWCTYMWVFNMHQCYPANKVHVPLLNLYQHFFIWYQDQKIASCFNFIFFITQWNKMNFHFLIAHLNFFFSELTVHAQFEVVFLWQSNILLYIANVWMYIRLSKINSCKFHILEKQWCLWMGAQRQIWSRHWRAGCLEVFWIDTFHFIPKTICV